MSQLVLGAIALIVVILVCTYAYNCLHLLLTITKCPDCGRIMQKVLYTDWADEKKKQISYECKFCQAKRIKKIRDQKGRKKTLYP
ncbi:MAG: hypothetical protein ACXVP5_08225 [Tumebacillaceae bacterium]